MSYQIKMFDTFPHSHQLESADCGPSCLRMIAKYYGRSYSIQYLREQAFNQTTNILISFLAARAVVSGEMTLGMMMSLTYIVGHIEQFIGFACAFQDAKISLERLGEIHQKEDEEQTILSKIDTLPEVKDIFVENLTFSYSGADRDYALEDITLTVPERKVTAIVGASGSGKTTLIKLLQGFYEPNKGNIKIGKPR